MFNPAERELADLRHLVRFQQELQSGLKQQLARTELELADSRTLQVTALGRCDRLQLEKQELQRTLGQTGAGEAQLRAEIGTQAEENRRLRKQIALLDERLADSESGRARLEARLVEQQQKEQLQRQREEELIESGRLSQLSRDQLHEEFAKQAAQLSEQRQRCQSQLDEQAEADRLHAAELVKQARELARCEEMLRKKDEHIRELVDKVKQLGDQGEREQQILTDRLAVRTERLLLLEQKLQELETSYRSIDEERADALRLHSSADAALKELQQRFAEAKAAFTQHLKRKEEEHLELMVRLKEAELRQPLPGGNQQLPNVQLLYAQFSSRANAYVENYTKEEMAQAYAQLVEAEELKDAELEKQQEQLQQVVAEADRNSLLMYQLRQELEQSRAAINELRLQLNNHESEPEVSSELHAKYKSAIERQQVRIQQLEEEKQQQQAELTDFLSRPAPPQPSANETDSKSPKQEKSISTAFLREKNTELQKEIGRLKHEHADHTASVERRQQQSKELLCQKKQQLEKLEIDYAGLQAQLEDQKTTVAQLERSMEEVGRQAGQLREKNLRLAERNKSLCEHLAAYKSQNELLEKNVDSEQMLRDSLKAENEKLVEIDRTSQQRQTQLKAEVSTLEAQVNDLQLRLDQSQHQSSQQQLRDLYELESKLQFAEKELASTKLALTGVSNEREQLQTKLTSVEAVNARQANLAKQRVTTLTDEVKRLTDELSRLSGKGHNDAEILELRRAKQTLTQDQQRRANELSIAKQELQRKTSELTAVKQEQLRCQAKLEQLERTQATISARGKSEFDRRLLEKEVELDSIKAMLKTAKEDKERCLARIRLMKANYDKLIEEMKKERVELLQMHEKQLAEAKVELADLKAKENARALIARLAESASRQAQASSCQSNSKPAPASLATQMAVDQTTFDPVCSLPAANTAAVGEKRKIADADEAQAEVPSAVLEKRFKRELGTRIETASPQPSASESSLPVNVTDTPVDTPLAPDACQTDSGSVSKTDASPSSDAAAQDTTLLSTVDTPLTASVSSPVPSASDELIPAISVTAATPTATSAEQPAPTPAAPAPAPAVPTTAPTVPAPTQPTIAQRRQMPVRGRLIKRPGAGSRAGEEPKDDEAPVRRLNRK